MFENAVRNKYRFPSTVGWLNVEDLWDLSVDSLDSVYKNLNSEFKKVSEESLMTKVTDTNTELQNKIDIVKYVFTTKVTEQEDRLKLKERREKKQYLLSLLQQKEDESYKSKSVEEIQSLINDL